MPFELVVRDADGNTVESYEFGDEQVTIGRRKHNRVILDDNAVSGDHALIEPTDGQYQLIDRKSLNGTYLDGEPIAPHRPFDLAHSASIGIGPFEIQFVDLAPDTTIHTIVRQDPSRIADRLDEQLRSAYANNVGASPAERRAAIRRVIEQGLSDLELDNRSSALAALTTRFRGSSSRDDDSVADNAAETEKLLLASRKAIENIAAAASIGRAPSDSNHVRRFAKLLEYFVEGMSTGLLQCLKVREKIRDNFNADVTALHGQQAGSIKGCRDNDQLSRLLLDWDNAQPEETAQKLAAAFEDLTKHQEAMVAGSVAASELILDRLDPDKIEAAAADGSWINATTSKITKAAVWTKYRELHTELREEDSRTKSQIMQKLQGGYVSYLSEAETHET